MTEKTKTVEINYTPELTAQIVESYTSGTSVDDIAKLVGKTRRSIIAKLVREKVYVKKTPVSKTGEPVTHKDELASAIGAVLSLTESEVDGLTKATKTGLQKIFTALANSKPL